MTKTNNPSFILLLVAIMISAFANAQLTFVPNPDKVYQITSSVYDTFLTSDGTTGTPYPSTVRTSEDTFWKFSQSTEGADLWYLERWAGGNLDRMRSKNEPVMVNGPANGGGGDVSFRIEVLDNGFYELNMPNRAASLDDHRIQVGLATVAMRADDFTGQVGVNITEVDVNVEVFEPDPDKVYQITSSVYDTFLTSDGTTGTPYPSTVGTSEDTFWKFSQSTEGTDLWYLERWAGGNLDRMGSKNEPILVNGPTNGGGGDVSFQIEVLDNGFYEISLPNRSSSVNDHRIQVGLETVAMRADDFTGQVGVNITEVDVSVEVFEPDPTKVYQITSSVYDTFLTSDGTTGTPYPSTVGTSEDTFWKFSQSTEGADLWYLERWAGGNLDRMGSKNEPVLVNGPTNGGGGDVSFQIEVLDNGFYEISLPNRSSSVNDHRIQVGLETVAMRADDFTGQLGVNITEVDVSVEVFEPNPDKVYQITSSVYDTFLTSDGTTGTPYPSTVGTSEDTFWKFSQSTEGADLWYLERWAGGNLDRMGSKNEPVLVNGPTNGGGGDVSFQIEVLANGFYEISLPNRSSSVSDHRIQVGLETVAMRADDFTGQVGVNITEVDEEIASVEVFEPDPTKVYQITSSVYDTFLTSDGTTVTPYPSTVGTSEDTFWKFSQSTEGADLWYLERWAGGSLDRMGSKNAPVMVNGPTNGGGGDASFRIEVLANGFYEISLPNRSSSVSDHRIQVGLATVAMRADDFTGQVGVNITEVDEEIASVEVFEPDPTKVYQITSSVYDTFLTSNGTTGTPYPSTIATLDTFWKFSQSTEGADLWYLERWAGGDLDRMGSKNAPVMVNGATNGGGGDASFRIEALANGFYEISLPNRSSSVSDHRIQVGLANVAMRADDFTGQVGVNIIEVDAEITPVIVFEPNPDKVYQITSSVYDTFLTSDGTTVTPYPSTNGTSEDTFWKFSQSTEGANLWYLERWAGGSLDRMGSKDVPVMVNGPTNGGGGDASFSIELLANGYYEISLPNRSSGVANHRIQVGLANVAMRADNFTGQVGVNIVEVEVESIAPVPVNRDIGHYRVYLLGGQSNANGRADASNLALPYSAVQTDVSFYWHKEQVATNGNLTQDSWINLAVGSGHGTTTPVSRQEFGPEISFGRSIADAYPKDNIAIIKFSYGGTNLSNDWAPNGAEYKTFIATVEAGLEALLAEGSTYDIEGMLWVQGEADATNLTRANAYESNLTELITNVRSEFGDGSNFPFYIAGLSTNSSYSDQFPSNAQIVREAQQAVASDVINTIYLNTNNEANYPFKSADPAHFTYEAMISMGNDFADLAIAFEGENPTTVIGGVNGLNLDSTYYVDTLNGYRLSAEGGLDDDLNMVSTDIVGEEVEWKFTQHDKNYYYMERVSSKTGIDRIYPATDGNDTPRLTSELFFTTEEVYNNLFEIEESSVNPGTYHITFMDALAEESRLTLGYNNFNNISDSVLEVHLSSNDNTANAVSFTFTEVVNPTIDPPGDFPELTITELDAKNNLVIHTLEEETSISAESFHAITDISPDLYGLDLVTANVGNYQVNSGTSGYHFFVAPSSFDTDGFPAEHFAHSYPVELAGSDVANLEQTSYSYTEDEDGLISAQNGAVAIIPLSLYKVTHSTNLTYEYPHHKLSFPTGRSLAAELTVSEDDDKEPVNVENTGPLTANTFVPGAGAGWNQELRGYEVLYNNDPTNGIAEFTEVEAGVTPATNLTLFLHEGMVVRILNFLKLNNPFLFFTEKTHYVYDDSRGFDIFDSHAIIGGVKYDEYEVNLLNGIPDAVFHADVYNQDTALVLPAFEGVEHAIFLDDIGVEAGLTQEQADLSESISLSIEDLNRPTQNTDDWDELYAAAAVANEELRALTEVLAASTGGEAHVREELKNITRARQKIDAWSAGNAAEITDIAGAYLLYDSIDDLYAGLEVVLNEVTVVRFSDRFINPANGYRDILMNVRMSNGHIVELRFHLRVIDDVQNESGHLVYEEVRDLEAEAESRELTPDEIEHLREIKSDIKAQFDEAWENRNLKSPKGLINNDTSISSDIATLNYLTVYPNPTSDNVSIKLNTTSEASVWVYDVTGKELEFVKYPINSQVENPEIKLDKYEDGVYLIKVEQDKNAFMHKVIKQ